MSLEKRREGRKIWVYFITVIQGPIDHATIVAAVDLKILVTKEHLLGLPVATAAVNLPEPELLPHRVIDHAVIVTAIRLKVSALKSTACISF